MRSWLATRPLTQQAAALICDEVTDGQVHLPQRTLAAMLGVQRPSLNKVLKDFEREGLIAIGYANHQRPRPRRSGRGRRSAINPRRAGDPTPRPSFGSSLY